MGLGGPQCPRARPAPTAQRCTKRQEFSLGEGIAALRPLPCTPCTPCTPHSALQVGGQLCARCRSSAGGGAGARPWLAPCACRLGVGGGVLFRGLAWRRGCLIGGLPARMEQKDPLRRCSRFGRRACPLSRRQALGSCGEKQKGKARPGERGRLNKTDDEGRSVPTSFANLFRNLLLRSILFEFALESAATHRARNTDFISASPVPA